MSNVGNVFLCDAVSFLRYFPAIVEKTSSRIDTAWSTSAFVTVSGGTKRNTSYPAEATSRPRSIAASSIRREETASLIPSISPRPLTSIATDGYLACKPFKDLMKYSLTSRTWRHKSPFNRRSSITQAPLMASRFPPNVAAWSPGRKISAAIPQAVTAPAGTPPCKSFCKRHHIGFDSVGLPCKRLTGTPHAALNFIEYQQKIFFITKFSQILKEVRSGRYNSAFSLNRFNHNCAGIFIRLRQYAFKIVEYRIFDFRQERVKIFIPKIRVLIRNEEFLSTS